MIVGCYSIDVYCDTRDQHPTGYENMPRWPDRRDMGNGDSYIGETRAACIRAARRVGWLIGKERQLCPFCVELKKAKKL